MKKHFRTHTPVIVSRTYHYVKKRLINKNYLYDKFFLIQGKQVTNCVLFIFGFENDTLIKVVRIIIILF